MEHRLYPILVFTERSIHSLFLHIISLPRATPGWLPQLFLISLQPILKLNFQMKEGNNLEEGGLRPILNIRPPPPAPALWAQSTQAVAKQLHYGKSHNATGVLQQQEQEQHIQDQSVSRSVIHF